MGQGCGPVETAVLGLTSFLSVISLTVTGFGAAQTFTLFYVLSSAIGLIKCGNLKYAVFLHTMGAWSSLPYIIYKSRKTWWKELDFFLLAFMMPSMALGSPTGNWLQVVLSVPWLEVIVGSILLCFALYAFWQARHKIIDCLWTHRRKSKDCGIEHVQPDIELRDTSDDTKEGDKEKLLGDNKGAFGEHRQDDEHRESEDGVTQQATSLKGAEMQEKRNRRANSIRDGGNNLIEEFRGEACTSQQMCDMRIETTWTGQFWQRLKHDFSGMTVVGTVGCLAAGFTGGVLGGLTGQESPCSLSCVVLRGVVL